MKIAKHWKPIAAAVVLIGLVAFGVILKMGHDDLERSTKAAKEVEAAKAGSSQCYLEALRGGAAPACTGTPITTTSRANGTEIPSRVASRDEEFDFAFARRTVRFLFRRTPPRGRSGATTAPKRTLMEQRRRWMRTRIHLNCGEG